MKLENVRTDRLDKVSKRIKKRIADQERIIEECEKKIEAARKEIRLIRSLCIHPETTHVTDPAGGALLL